MNLTSLFNCHYFHLEKIRSSEGKLFSVSFQNMLDLDQSLLARILRMGALIHCCLDSCFFKGHKIIQNVGDIFEMSEFLQNKHDFTRPKITENVVHRDVRGFKTSK